MYFPDTAAASAVVLMLKTGLSTSLDEYMTLQVFVSLRRERICGIDGIQTAA